MPTDHEIVLISHYPLRRDLVRLFRIPRFIVWCGTRQTEAWHTKYPISAVVTGHLINEDVDLTDVAKKLAERGVEPYLDNQADRAQVGESPLLLEVA